jgi:hypothetical protein
MIRMTTTVPAGLGLRSAIALGIAAIAPATPGQAASFAFGLADSVTDTTTSGSTAASATVGADLAVAPFDPSEGVLMGTTLQVVSTATQTLTASISEHDKRKGATTVTGTGATTALSFVAPGVDSSFGGAVVGPVETSCVTTNLGCAAPPVSSTVEVSSGTLSVPAGSLNAYVGLFDVLNGFSPITTKLSASISVNATRSDAPSGIVTSTYGLDWQGTVNVVHEVLAHAAPSFASGATLLTLALDFGTITPGTAELPFTLYNLAGERVGLDLDGIDRDGTTDAFGNSIPGAAPSPFSIGSCGFTALAAGTGQTCLARIDTDSAGAYEARYTFRLSDADVGASASRFDHFLALELRATVVPLPAPLLPLAAALGSLAVLRRRRP